MKILLLIAVLQCSCTTNKIPNTPEYEYLSKRRNYQYDEDSGEIIRTKPLELETLEYFDQNGKMVKIRIK